MKICVVTRNDQEVWDERHKQAFSEDYRNAESVDLKKLDPSQRRVRIKKVLFELSHQQNSETTKTTPPLSRWRKR